MKTGLSRICGPWGRAPYPSEHPTAIPVHTGNWRPIFTWMRIALGIIAVAIAVLIGTFAYDREGFWHFLAGPPDLGPVEFRSLVSPDNRNHFLACPEGLCLDDETDMTSPIYGVDAGRLQVLSREAWGGEPLAEMVAADDFRLRDRYVTHSPIMRFPDTVSVRFIELPDGQSSVAIYSRGKLGEYDFGANRDRVLRWISLLDESVRSAEG